MIVDEEKGTGNFYRNIEYVNTWTNTKKPTDLLGEKLNIETDELTRNCF